jgi:hypothetical protein
MRSKVGMILVVVGDYDELGSKLLEQNLENARNAECPFLITLRKVSGRSSVARHVNRLNPRPNCISSNRP